MKPSPAKADLVLVNGFIYTLDSARRVAAALAVHRGRIVFVGETARAQAWVGPHTRLIDMRGRLVLPGFVDSHCHLTSGVCELNEPILHGINDIAGYQRAVRDFALTHPDSRGIQAGGWVNAVFGIHGPGRELLDAVVPAVPVLLYSEDYHNAWVNTKALQMAGVTAATPDPPDGIIEREQDGTPSGTLRETAVDLVKPVIPAYTVAQIKEGLLYFQKKAHALGITAVFNPLVSRKDLTDLHALHELQDSGRLRLHVPSAVEVEPGDGLEVVEELVRLRSQEAGEYFRIQAAKIFMDGVLEGGTAYLEEPYLHLEGSRGIVNWETEKFKRMCAALDRAGLQIHVHSIGDAATRLTLDGFADARLHNGSRDSRHAITHLQLVHPADIDRFAELGVVAVPQPYWFGVDANYQQALAFLGPERADRQYPMQSFFARGVLVASASDYNVTLVPDPLLAIEMGITRKIPGDTVMYAQPDSGKALVPDERVSVEAMLASFTINGAYAAFLEKETGSLEPGKKADFIVLDQNILQLEAGGIHNARVLLTFFEGQEVFRRESLDE